MAEEETWVVVAVRQFPESHSGRETLAQEPLAVGYESSAVAERMPEAAPSAKEHVLEEDGDWVKLQDEERAPVVVPYSSCLKRRQHWVGSIPSNRPPKAPLPHDQNP